VTRAGPGHYCDHVNAVAPQFLVQRFPRKSRQAFDAESFAHSGIGAKPDLEHG